VGLAISADGHRQLKGTDQMKKQILACALALMLLACGGANILAGFRVGFSIGKPIAQDLAAQHVISQAAADAVIADVDDGINDASKAEQCVSLAGSSKPAKARCYFTLAQDLRGILARHHIGGAAKLDQIAAIANSVITALEAYFHQVTGDQPMLTAGVKTDPDKALESAMKKAKADMDALK
jgi:hypothetical protein